MMLLPCRLAAFWSLELGIASFQPLPYPALNPAWIKQVFYIKCLLLKTCIRELARLNLPGMRDWSVLRSACN